MKFLYIASAFFAALVSASPIAEAEAEAKTGPKVDLLDHDGYWTEPP